MEEINKIETAINSMSKLNKKDLLLLFDSAKTGSLTLFQEVKFINADGTVDIDGDKAEKAIQYAKNVENQTKLAKWLMRYDITVEEMIKAIYLLRELD